MLAAIGAKDGLHPKDLGPNGQSTDASVRAYQGSEELPRRSWALSVQLYGVRSRRNWGHGDFTDLANLVDLAATIIQLCGVGPDTEFHDAVGRPYRITQGTPIRPLVS